jgi:hypothetical protein
MGLLTRITGWSSPVAVEVASEAMVQRAGASARRQGQRRSAHVMRFGARFGSKLAFRTGGPIEPWFGWELSLLRPAFEVRVEEERLNNEGPLRLGVAVGARLAPFF